MMVLQAVLLLALGVTWQVSADSGCSSGWYRHDLKCYGFYTSWNYNWATALSQCKRYGYEIASPRSTREREWLRHVIKEKGYDFRIGLRRVNGRWLWHDNQPYTIDARDWVPGSPSSGSSEMCVYAAPCTGGKWKEVSCSTSKRTLCTRNGRHGGWGSWSSWSRCSKTCGTGRQSRSRSCNRPSQITPGYPCQGHGDEYRHCNTQYCPLGWQTCTVGGDPHYLTFDRMGYDFQGGDIQGRECKFLLAGRCKHTSSLPPFKILTSNDHRGNSRVSWVKAIELHYKRHVIRVDTNFRRTGRIYVDGVAVYADNYRGVPGVTVSKLRDTVRLSIEDGLVYVSYNGHRRVTVGVDKCLRSNGGLCGLCGNYDGSSSNDLYLRNGTRNSNRNDLGWSYQEPNQDGRFCHKAYIPPCTSKSCSSASQCNILTSTSVFGNCPRYYNAKDACATDMCCANIRPHKCDVYRAYVDACNRMGYTVPSTWQLRTGCSNPSCPPNSRYVSTADACQQTCTGVIDGCENIYKKGACVCNSGYVWYQNKCIRKDHCGCRESSGEVHPIGATWLDQCCKKRYRCYKPSSGKPSIQISSVKCNSAARCNLDNGTFACQCMPGYTGSGYSCSGFRCPSRAKQLYEDPLRCKYYYYCNGGVAKHYQCSGPLVYNDEYKGCLLTNTCPNPNKCADKLKGLLKRELAVEKLSGWVGDGHFDCPVVHGAFRNPGTCNQFFACANGTAVEGVCEHGSHFSPEESKCVLTKVKGC